MSDTALFVGWGAPYPGHERFARETFDAWLEILKELEVEGEIEGFDTFMLAPHGGDLRGFGIIHGEPQKLIALTMREDLRRLQARAELANTRFGIVPAVTGDGVARELDVFAAAVDEFERTPVVV